MSASFCSLVRLGFLFIAAVWSKTYWEKLLQFDPRLDVGPICLPVAGSISYPTFLFIFLFNKVKSSSIVFDFTWSLKVGGSSAE